MAGFLKHILTKFDSRAKGAAVRFFRRPETQRKGMVISMEKSIQNIQIADLMKIARVQAALGTLKDDDANTIAEQCRICEIPAPSDDEANRAVYMKKQFEALGLETKIDNAGNVISLMRGSEGNKNIYIGAHLDTVFSGVYDIKVRREGNVFYAPGIADNCRGLAAILTVARVMKKHGIVSKENIYFCCTVGEEKNGAMTGARAVLDEAKNNFDACLVVDSAGTTCYYCGVFASFGYATFKANGGHGYRHFGRASAINALGLAIGSIAQLPRTQAGQSGMYMKSTWNIGTVSGGTSNNAIAGEAKLGYDIRAEEKQDFLAAEEMILNLIRKAAADENEMSSDKSLSVEISCEGRLEGGTQSADAPIVQITKEAAEALDYKAQVARGPVATEANIPISRGIPAIHLAGGGSTEFGHSLKEKFDATDAYMGIQHILLVLLTIAGIDPAAEEGEGQ